MVNKITVTKAEQQAIKALQKLAKTWPQSLELFSWSGSLTVLKEGQDGRKCLLPDNFHGIPNDGGDPDKHDVDQCAEFEYEQ